MLFRCHFTIVFFLCQKSKFPNFIDKMTNHSSSEINKPCLQSCDISFPIHKYFPLLLVACFVQNLLPDLVLGTQTVNYLAPHRPNPKECETHSHGNIFEKYLGNYWVKCCVKHN